MKTFAMIQSTLPLHSLLTPRKCCVKCHAAPHFEGLTKVNFLNYPDKRGLSYAGNVKLLNSRVGLPRNVISFNGCPLLPAMGTNVIMDWV